MCSSWPCRETAANRHNPEAALLAIHPFEALKATYPTLGRRQASAATASLQGGRGDCEEYVLAGQDIPIVPWSPPVVRASGSGVWCVSLGEGGAITIGLGAG